MYNNATIVPVLGWLGACGAFGFVLWAQVPPTPPPQPVGPFVTNITADSATVLWADPSPIRYGAYGRLDKTINFLDVSHATLTGLKPGETYAYHTPGGDGSFTAPPARNAPAGSDAFTFAIFGDNRGVSDVYMRLMTALIAAKPSFVMNTGSMVSGADDAGQWAALLRASRELLRHTVFFPVMGTYDGNSSYWLRYFDRTTAYYSFDWGKSHWAVINTQPPGNDENYWSQELAWLDKDLTANRDAPFLFVALHIPPFSAVRSHKDEAGNVNRRVLALLKKHKISAAFSAHDHNYQRHVDAGITYVVSAGAGTQSYDANDPVAQTVQTARVEHYVWGQASGDTISFEAREMDGKVVDRFELHARKP